MFFKIDLKKFATFPGKQLFLIKWQAFRPVTLLKKTQTLVLSHEFCEIFKGTFFYKTPSVATSIWMLRRKLMSFKSLIHNVTKCSRHTLENLAKNAAKFLKCIRPLWGIMHQLVHDGGPYHIETSPLVCRAN